MTAKKSKKLPVLSRVDFFVTKFGIPSTKKLIQKILTKGDFIVTFTKTNGETRVMPCTLNPKTLTDVKAMPNSNNPDVLRIWDLENKDWRSFRIDSVKKIEEEKI